MLTTPEMPPTMSRAPETAESSFIVRAGLLLAMPAHSFPVAHAALSLSVPPMCLANALRAWHAPRWQLSAGLQTRTAFEFCGAV